jgi:hypothetical protein
MSTRNAPANRSARRPCSGLLGYVDILRTLSASASSSDFVAAFCRSTSFTRALPVATTRSIWRWRPDTNCSSCATRLRSCLTV